MTVAFAPRPRVAPKPDHHLLNLCDNWRELSDAWERRAYHWFGDANRLYRNDLQPLLEEIAATPAETDEGFAAKLAIIIEDDLCGVVSSICDRMGTDCPGAMLIERPELLSKGAPKKRGRRPS